MAYLALPAARRGVWKAMVVGERRAIRIKNVFGEAEERKGTAKELLSFLSSLGESDCGSAARLMLVR
jgi:hypothetical protein